MRKIKKIFTCALAAAILLCSLGGQALAAEPIEYTSPSVIVTELVSGNTIISEQPDMEIAPGAMTKMAALYVVAKACFNGTVSLDDEITITADVMANDSGVIPLKEGEVFNLEQLLYLFYMDYSNTAAYAAALHTSGSFEAFISEMNTAASLAGCENTVFTTITGFYSEGQKTTPTDMVTFLKMAIQNTIFKAVFTALTYEVPETALSLSRSLVTENLVQRLGSSYGSSHCVGGKQGGHDETGYATVTLSKLDTKTENEDDEEEETEENQMELIVIAAGAPDSDTSYSDVYNLIEWTFKNFSWSTILYRGEAVERVPVEMANGTDYVVAGPSRDITVLLDNEITASEFDRDVVIYPPDEGENYVAPINRGDVLGELTLSYKGEIYGRVPLVANQDVNLRHWAFFKNEVKQSLENSKLGWVITAFCVMIAAYIVYTVLFWYMRISKKRKAKIIRQQIIAERQSGKAYENTAIMTKEAKLPDETDHTVERISGALNDSVEIGDISAPDISEIADIINSENKK